MSGTDCSDPVITAVSPANAPTAGGTVILVDGFFLGTTTTATLFIIGNQTRPCENVLQHIPSRIVCSVPAGQPADAIEAGWLGLKIVVGPKESQVAYDKLRYDAPKISSISPASAPTTTSAVITITGENFGLAPVVTFGPYIAVTVSELPQTHTQLHVYSPHAAGLRDVRVRVASQQSGPQPFSYQRPSVMSAGPELPPTDGAGHRLTILGGNFGLPDESRFGAATVTVGGIDCPVLEREDGRIVCDTPPGKGVQQVLVTVAGAPGNKYNLLYAGPVISRVSGCVDVAGLYTEQCDPRGGTTITIFGANFGAGIAGQESTPVLSVRIGELVCPDLAMPVPHTRLTCTLPSGVGTNVSVIVQRGSAIRATVPFLSYNGPYFTHGTLQFVSGGPKGYIVAASTAGGQEVSLHGDLFQFLSTNPADVQVFYGPLGQPTKYSCINLRDLSGTHVKCTMVPGVGRDLRFTLISSGFASAQSVDAVSYPSPVVTPASLRLRGAPNGTTNLVSTDRKSVV